MALPLLLVAGAIIAGGAGVAVGASAKGDLDEAKRINKRAEDILRDASESLEHQRRQTQERLTRLGYHKRILHHFGLRPFVHWFLRIKNVDYTSTPLGEDWRFTEDDTFTIQRTVTNMENVVGFSAGSLAAGTLVGLATYGSVGFLGTASTGTAIVGLSGAAASNATLAWFGGGAVAAGGGGTALGAAALGGIALGPALLVGSLILQSKANEALQTAHSNVARSQLAAEKLQVAAVGAQEILDTADEVTRVLKELQADHLGGHCLELQRLVTTNEDYRTYSEAEKHLVMRTASVARTANIVAEARLFDEKGIVTKEIRRILKQANDFLKAANRM